MYLAICDSLITEKDNKIWFSYIFGDLIQTYLIYTANNQYLFYAKGIINNANKAKFIYMLSSSSLQQPS